MTGAPSRPAPTHMRPATAGFIFSPCSPRLPSCTMVSLSLSLASVACRAFYARPSSCLSPQSSALRPFVCVCLCYCVCACVRARLCACLLMSAGVKLCVYRPARGGEGLRPRHDMLALFYVAILCCPLCAHVMLSPVCGSYKPLASWKISGDRLQGHIALPMQVCGV
jgi:hypothetical protein